jgi:hypothetical protein
MFVLRGEVIEFIATIRTVTLSHAAFPIYSPDASTAETDP